MPFILSHPVNEAYRENSETRRVRNFDIFDFALNGAQVSTHLKIIKHSQGARCSNEVARFRSGSKPESSMRAHVFRFAHRADIAQCSRHVRFVPKAEALDRTIILPFSQLGGLHGAQWSRSSDLKRIIEDQVTTAEFANGAVTHMEGEPLHVRESLLRLKFSSDRW